MFTLTSQDLHGVIVHNLYGGFGEEGPRVFPDYSPTIRTASGGGHIPSVIQKVGNTNPSGRGMNGNVYDSEGLAPTITTNKGEGPKILTPQFRVRKLTPKECFRLQGIPDELFDRAKTALNETFYKGKDKSDSQLYKQAGNAVTANVAEAIARSIKEFLEC